MTPDADALRRGGGTSVLDCVRRCRVGFAARGSTGLDLRWLLGWGPSAFGRSRMLWSRLAMAFAAEVAAATMSR